MLLVLELLKNIFLRHSAQSPDPVIYFSQLTSGVALDLSRHVRDVSLRYASKLSGALSAVSGVALASEGLRVMDPSWGPVIDGLRVGDINWAFQSLSQVDPNWILIGSASVSLASDTILIAHGDPSRQINTENPQDRPHQWRDIFHPKDYPHESSTAGYTFSSALMSLGDLTSGKIDTSLGYLAAGMTDLLGSAITLRVREKKVPTEKFTHPFLNIPGIKQFSNLAETRTNMAAGLISVSGLSYLTLTNLNSNGWNFTESSPILTFAFATIGSEIAYWFSQKRGFIAEAAHKNNDSSLQMLGNTSIDDLDRNNEIA